MNEISFIGSQEIFYMAELLTAITPKIKLKN